jgi:hypothetical protein
MRIPSVLLAAAAACCLLGSLTGCSSASGGTTNSDIPAPVASAAALDLAGTTWSVREEPGTTVHFDGLGITVSADGRSSSYAWAAQGDQVLVGVSTSSLNGPVGATWLTSATEVARTADGWILRDAKGGTTATLTTAGSASPAPTTATSLLGTAKPGSGVVDAPVTALDGTWASATTAKSTITFADGQWRAAGSCATGAIGGRGAYRVLPGGRLLAVRTMTPIRGCPISRDDPVARSSAITAIARAGSFRISGDTLTLFDRAGVQLGSLVRA